MPNESMHVWISPRFRSIISNIMQISLTLPAFSFLNNERWIKCSVWFWKKSSLRDFVVKDRQVGVFCLRWLMTYSCTQPGGSCLLEAMLPPRLPYQNVFKSWRVNAWPQAGSLRPGIQVLAFSDLNQSSNSQTETWIYLGS